MNTRGIVLTVLAAWALIDTLILAALWRAGRARDRQQARDVQHTRTAMRQQLITSCVDTAADQWTAHYGDVLPDAWLRLTTNPEQVTE